MEESIYALQIKEQKQHIDEYLKEQYGDNGFINYLSKYGNIQLLPEIQKSSRQFQFRKQLIGRLFDEALMLIARETRYGLALNDEKDIEAIKQKLKQEANDYWLFKKIIQLRNWDYNSFLHAIDVYVLAYLYLKKNTIKAEQDFLKAALYMNLGRLYIPKNILRKPMLSKKEKDIFEHHCLWSVEIAKDKVSHRTHKLLNQHYQLTFNRPFEDEDKMASEVLSLLDAYSELTLLGKNRRVLPAVEALTYLNPSKPAVKNLMDLFHIYPENTAVELTNGTRAVINKINPDVPFLPIIKEENGSEYQLPFNLSIKVKSHLSEAKQTSIDSYYDITEENDQYAFQLFEKRSQDKDIEEVYKEVFVPAIKKLVIQKKNPAFMERIFLKWMWDQYGNI